MDTKSPGSNSKSTKNFMNLSGAFEMRKRHPGTLVYPHLLLFLFSPFVCQSHAGEETLHDTFKIGYSSIIHNDVDPRDAQIAMDLWASELNRFAEISVNTSPKSIKYSDLPSMIEAFQKRKVDLLTLSGLDFLRHRNIIPLEPAFISACQTSRSCERVFLVRKESAPPRIDLLKNKTLALQSDSRDEISNLWLETLLAGEGIADWPKFFGQVKEFPKSSRALMALFFRQADAALVSRSTFETMAELNPQIEKAIQVMFHSKPLVENIGCFHRDVSENVKQKIRDKVPQLHQSPKFKQMFTLLQTNRIILFQPSHLDNLVELLREYQGIRNKSAARR